MRIQSSHQEHERFMERMSKIADKTRNMVNHIKERKAFSRKVSARIEQIKKKEEEQMNSILVLTRKYLEMASRSA